MADAPAKQYLVRRSKRLPWWLWISIAHALGIRIQPNDRVVLAGVLYTSTIISALGNDHKYSPRTKNVFSVLHFVLNSVGGLHWHLRHRPSCSHTCWRSEA